MRIHFLKDFFQSHRAHVIYCIAAVLFLADILSRFIPLFGT